MKNIIPLCALWLLSASLALHAEDLVEIYQLAESTNPQLKASWAHYQAASAIQDQSTALLLPTIQMQVKASKNGISSTLSNPSQAFGSSLTNTNDNFIQNDLVLSLNQPIYHHDLFHEKRELLYLGQLGNPMYQGFPNSSFCKVTLG